MVYRAKMALGSRKPRLLMQWEHLERLHQQAVGIVKYLTCQQGNTYGPRRFGLIRITPMKRATQCLKWAKRAKRANVERKVSVVHKACKAHKEPKEYRVQRALMVKHSIPTLLMLITQSVVVLVKQILTSHLLECIKISMLLIVKTRKTTVGLSGKVAMDGMASRVKLGRTEEHLTSTLLMPTVPMVEMVSV